MTNHPTPKKHFRPRMHELLEFTYLVEWLSGFLFPDH